MRNRLLTTCLTIACLSAAAPSSAQGTPDQLKMELTKPTTGNYPPLPRGFGTYQILSFGTAKLPFQFPGIAGGLAVDPLTMVVVPDRGGFGYELDGYLRALGQTPLTWQTLSEQEKNYFVLSETLKIAGSGESKQVDDVRTCETRALIHFKDVVRDGLAPGWQKARGLLPPAPMYRPDVRGVAYYEFPVDAGGFIVVSTGEHDLPIPHWNDQGIGLAEDLQKRAAANKQKVARIFKLDSLTYVGEDEGGTPVAQIGDLPPKIVPAPKNPSGFALEKWSSWKDLKGEFLGTYRPLIENQRMAGADLWHVERSSGDGAWGPWHQGWAGSHSDQRVYDQFDYNGCAVGCGPVAWAMLFGWGDYRAAVGDSRWRHRWGLYRQNGGRGADATAPSSNDAGVDNAVRELHNHCATFCLVGNGATFPWDMHQADRYLSGRTGATLTTHYNSIGIQEGRLRELARDSIYAGTPAIIGTGWLSHYPLAYGYAWRSKTESFLWWDYTVYSRWFYVNSGWGGSGNGWVDAGTWFCGRLFAN